MSTTQTILRYIVLSGIFLVPSIVLLVSESMFFPFITGKNFAFRILVEIMFSAWLLLALLNAEYRPRFSWIIVSFFSLLAVMFFANAMGESPLKSFWSNFERMEGYVTLVHVFLYALVMGSSIRTEKLWNALFNTTLAVALIVVVYALGQLGNVLQISQGTSWRVDGTLGNSTYMAVYMLFHIFIAGLMLVRTRISWMRYVYGGLVVLFVFILVQTGTRGAVLGLAGGTLLSAGYIALFTHGHALIRKVAIGVLLFVIIATGLLIGFRETSFIQDDPRLARVANISLDAGSTRFAIWSLAFEGFKERPILGWGQENFSYVFNTYYTAELYGQEPWFDRVHNVVLDWLVAGGILGFLFYVGIFVAAVAYLIVLPIIRKDTSPFTPVERGILFGLLAAYTLHNLFVFDNLISYIFFGVILAFIHQRVSQPIERVNSFSIKTETIEQIMAPILLVATLGLLYVLHVPNILASRNIIDALTARTIEERIESFESALSRNTFALQEVREQLVLQTARDVGNPNISDEMKQVLVGKAHEEIQKQIEEKPGDARVYAFAAILYRAIGNVDLEIQHLEIARTLSPQKQQFMFEQAFAYLKKEDVDSALVLLNEAFELAPENTNARVFYALGALYANNRTLFDSLMTTDEYFAAFAQNDTAVQTTYTLKEYSLLIRSLEYRLLQNPYDASSRVNLAIALFEHGNPAEAIRIAEEGIALDPSFEAQGREIINAIKESTL